MDRAMSDEEKIRRAEDVAERRKQINFDDDCEGYFKNRAYLIKKHVVIQILICVFFYCGMYIAHNSDNPKLQYIVNSVYEVLDRDIDFNNIFQFIVKKNSELNGFFDSLINTKDEEKNELGDLSMSDYDGNMQLIEPAVVNEIKHEESIESAGINGIIQGEFSELWGIGGADLESDETPTNDEDKQMLADSYYIKNNYSIIKPLSNYIVTSEFGTRKSSAVVSANHKGIDLGASTGTDIFSSMDGTVVEASKTGDYGIHLKIKNNNVEIIYAHCSKLNVKEGDFVTKGKKIAEVGSTGKATGPHLHFEVRVDSRAVNPRLLMEF